MSISSQSKSTKAEQTKQKIMDSYLNLMQEKVWDKITVKDLCQDAAITRGTFYQYYDDIYDLMERIQQPLIDELEQTYQQITADSAALSTDSSCHGQLSGMHDSTDGIAAIDCTPPDSLIFWYDFCKKHKTSMQVLLGSNGDSYFLVKIKNILRTEINTMMDADGMPHDNLRTHFSKAFIELHLMTARTWLDSDDDKFLSVDEILAIMNAMRIGANYLSYQEKTQQ